MDENVKIVNEELNEKKIKLISVRLSQTYTDCHTLMYYLPYYYTLAKPLHYGGAKVVQTSGYLRE